MLRRTWGGAALLGLAAMPAGAADHYVDVVNGLDTNSGATPSTAWKTLRHASIAAPAGAATIIHVAPGVYSPASGEVLPLRFHQQVLVADQGPDVTHVDGQSSSTLIAMNAFSAGLVESLSRIEGFDLLGADILINVSQSQGAISTEVVDCRLNPSVYGISQSSGDTLGPFTIALRGVTIDGGQRALNFTPVGGVQATLTDCTLRNCSGGAITYTGQGALGLSVTRTRIENSGTGIDAYFTQIGGGTITLVDSLLAHNQDGLRATKSSMPGSFALHGILRRCTVADNAGTGVSVTGGTGGTSDATFDGCVLHGNGIHVSATTAITSSVFTQLGGANPQFVDRVQGDYRLRFGSPCIDAADPATAVGTLDLAQVARPIDGDLDTNERADIGAFEHTPLRLVTSGRIGTPLRLESSGEIGGTSTIYFTRGAPFAPMTTPFGQFDLNPSAFGTLLHTNVAPFPPVGFQRPIPNLPYLIGHTFSFQGLTTSSAAPQGSAYTNVVSVTILP